MSATKVSPEVRARRLAWIKALESGEYSQGRRALRTDDGYCCIGACASAVFGIVDDDLLGKLDDGVWVDDPDSGPWYDTVDEQLGFPYGMQTHLIHMNDIRRRDFRFIARFLRKAWGLTDA